MYVLFYVTVITIERYEFGIPAVLHSVVKPTVCTPELTVQRIEFNGSNGYTLYVPSGIVQEHLGLTSSGIVVGGVVCVNINVIDVDVDVYGDIDISLCP